MVNQYGFLITDTDANNQNDLDGLNIADLHGTMANYMYTNLLEIKWQFFFSFFSLESQNSMFIMYRAVTNAIIFR